VRKRSPDLWQRVIPAIWPAGFVQRPAHGEALSLAGLCARAVSLTRPLASKERSWSLVGVVRYLGLKLGNAQTVRSVALPKPHAQQA
jgi:hypothetical protein